MTVWAGACANGLRAGPWLADRADGAGPDDDTDGAGPDAGPDTAEDGEEAPGAGADGPRLHPPTIRRAANPATARTMVGAGESASGRPGRGIGLRLMSTTVTSRPR